MPALKNTPNEPKFLHQKTNQARRGRGGGR